MIAVAFLVLVGCAAVLYALTSRQRAVRVTVLAVASVGMWLLLERFAEVTPVSLWNNVESVLTEMCAELQEHSDVPLTVDSAIDAAYENWRVNELLDSRWLQESDVEDLATAAFYRWGGRR